MKKSLIALAALAAVTAASAQSTVAISGALVLGVGTSKTDATSTGPQIVRQTGNIAFKGSEDLGGGLKANFEVQQAIGAHAATALNVAGASAAATTLGDRGLYINLTGGFGAVQAGRAASAVRALFGAIGDVSNLPVQTGISAGNSTSSTDAKGGDANARVIYGDAYSNFVSYTTPSISGFTASVALAAVDGDTTATKDTKSYSLQYTNGPLNVAYNLTDSPQTSAGKVIAQGTGIVADTAYIAAVGAYKMSTALASYDFGVAKVGVTVQNISLDTGVNPGSAYSVIAMAPLGNGNLSGGFGKRKASATTELQFGDEVKQTFIGYKYNLSKRTHVSAVWNKIDRQGATTTNDLKETHIFLGHSF